LTGCRISDADDYYLDPALFEDIQNSLFPATVTAHTDGYIPLLPDFFDSALLTQPQDTQDTFSLGSQQGFSINFLRTSLADNNPSRRDTFGLYLFDTEVDTCFIRNRRVCEADDRIVYADTPAGDISLPLLHAMRVALYTPFHANAPAPGCILVDPGADSLIFTATADFDTKGTPSAFDAPTINFRLLYAGLQLTVVDMFTSRDITPSVDHITIDGWPTTAHYNLRSGTWENKTSAAVTLSYHSERTQSGALLRTFRSGPLIPYSLSGRTLHLRNASGAALASFIWNEPISLSSNQALRVTLSLFSI
jgi:hypothetical protein